MFFQIQGKIHREECRSSLTLCREPRLIVTKFAYANELTSFSLVMRDFLGIPTSCLLFMQATGQTGNCPNSLLQMLPKLSFFFEKRFNYLDWYDIFLYPVGIFSDLYSLNWED